MEIYKETLIERNCFRFPTWKLCAACSRQDDIKVSGGEDPKIQARDVSDGTVEGNW